MTSLENRFGKDKRDGVNCLHSKECGKYCLLLDSLTGESYAEDDCEWPEKIDGPIDHLATASDRELAEAAATTLSRTLKAARTVHNALNTQGNELGIAHGAYSAIFAARMSLWTKYAEAAQNGRQLTDVEVETYSDRMIDAIRDANESIESGGVNAKMSVFGLAMVDRETLGEHGILFDEAMCETVTTLCANASMGRSTLLIGDKGIAKTQAARFVSGMFAHDGVPRIISGDGSMMKDEFIGKVLLKEENGASVTEFEPGIIIECMEQGVPLVIDEVNLIDPAIAMRLQDILLKKPGDKITIQEDPTRQITIAQGFCVFATANEASNRYRSRAALDPAFRDRFDIIPVEYPDGDAQIISDLPEALTRLAYTFTISAKGIQNPRVSPDDAAWLAKVAHASQQLYSKPARDVAAGLPGSATASLLDDDEPRMSDCISPRKMVDILSEVASGINPYDTAAGVRGVAYSTIAGMQHRADRLQMFDVIRMMSAKGELDEQAVAQLLRT